MTTTSNILRYAILAFALLLLTGQPASAQPRPAWPKNTPLIGPILPSLMDVSISKETTHLTEPLAEDGYVDYLKAVNDLASKGVTPENNAAVPLWRALGPGILEEEEREAYLSSPRFRDLGVEFAEPGQEFIAWDDFIRRDFPMLLHPREGESEYDARSRVWEMLNVASKPWDQKQHQVLSRWLTANEASLKLLIEASQRTKYYSPIMAREDALTEQGFLRMANAYDGFFYYDPLVDGPLIYGAADLCGALKASAMSDLHHGDFDKAWLKLHAWFKLARVFSHGPLLWHTADANWMELRACLALEELLQDPRIDAVRLRRIQKQLNSLPPMANSVDKLDKVHRWEFLDAMTRLPRHNLSLLTYYFPEEHRNPAFHIGGYVLSALADWDRVLRRGNERFDRTVEIFKIKEHQERLKQLSDESDKALEAMLDATDRAKSIGAYRFNQRRRIFSEYVAATWTYLWTTSHWPPGIRRRGHNVRSNLCKSAIAARLYHAKHGKWPADVASLGLPKGETTDPYADAPLKFLRVGGGLMIYSVGANEHDDLGQQHDDERDDIGIILQVK